MTRLDWSGRLTDAGLAWDDLMARQTHDRTLGVTWFNSWSKTVDDALDELPEARGCTHEQLRILASDGSVPKRHALVEEGGSPIAVVSVRRRPTFWEPVTDLCLATVTIPARHDQVGRVLGNLGRDVRLGAFEGDPSELAPTKSRPYNFYAADLTTDYERHWRSKGRLSTLKSARKLYPELLLEVDRPDDLVWTIDRWHQMWCEHADRVVVAAPDMRLIWPSLLAEGTLHSLALVDEGRPVAGLVLLERNGGVTLRITARDGDDRYGSVMTRLLEATFEWAASSGYRSFDLGGGFDYKRWWAPVGGERHRISFTPGTLVTARAQMKRVRRASLRARASVQKAFESTSPRRGAHGA